eukprot:CAMPEP_0179075106 /NCGR_PEP_ID=MMETSP0796-20121207/33424_1 /TAXON_ID=73915 /ORGANISM="Pyrodinium bahamense, Strain pbaha01" /LENGTH=84 /DNA_ID=CAMNT_0020772337 /DNA_START=63 /DNA_END=317 /DNA_ORIENTATION=-
MLKRSEVHGTGDGHRSLDVSTGLVFEANVIDEDLAPRGVVPIPQIDVHRLVSEGADTHAGVCREGVRVHAVLRGADDTVVAEEV